jgi:hypothetical protein
VTFKIKFRILYNKQKSNFKKLVFFCSVADQQKFACQLPDVQQRRDQRQVGQRQERKRIRLSRKSSRLRHAPRTQGRVARSRHRVRDHGSGNFGAGHFRKTRSTRSTRSVVALQVDCVLKVIEEYSNLLDFQSICRVLSLFLYLKFKNKFLEITYVLCLKQFNAVICGLLYSQFLTHRTKISKAFKLIRTF